jgi:AcrR family transcriptional regulator
LNTLLFLSLCLFLPFIGSFNLAAFERCSPSANAVAKSLGMSQGNLTFHFPTKEHLLAVLVDMLCDYQWKRMEQEANDGVSSILAICLELTAMASACESDDTIKDFFLSAYSSPLCLDIIRKNDAKRAKEVFGAYRPDWTDEQFAEAEILVSGIEHATLMVAGDPVTLETRITGALNCILTIYGVPEETRKMKLQKVFTRDCMSLGKRILEEFREYVANANDEAFYVLIKR